MSIPIQIVSSWYYGGFFSTSIEKFLVLEPFLRSPQKIFDFEFFTSPTYIFHKCSVTEVMLYILLTKFFTFCRFSFSPIPMLLVSSCYYGGSSRHQLKTFWSINLFLGAFKKFSIFIFWRVRYASFSDQPFLILYILLTKILMFFINHDICLSREYLVTQHVPQWFLKVIWNTFWV